MFGFVVLPITFLGGTYYQWTRLVPVKVGGWHWLQTDRARQPAHLRERGHACRLHQCAAHAPLRHLPRAPRVLHTVPPDRPPQLPPPRPGLSTFVVRLWPCRRRSTGWRRRAWSPGCRRFLRLGVRHRRARGAHTPGRPARIAPRPRSCPSRPGRHALHLRPRSQRGRPGQFADASAIGWAANGEGVVACLGGSFYVQASAAQQLRIRRLRRQSQTTWTNLDGYLPALGHGLPPLSVTDVSITELRGRGDIGGRGYVAIYSRVAVRNPTGQVIHLDPDLARARGPESATVDVKAPRHGRPRLRRRRRPLRPALSLAVEQRTGRRRQLRTAPRPHARVLERATCRRSPQLQLPDNQLVDAYRSGFIYTQIARSGVHLDTGVNNYQSEYSHDVVGILANLFTQGDFDRRPRPAARCPQCGRLAAAVRGRRCGPTPGPGPSTYSRPGTRLRAGQLLDRRPHRRHASRASRTRPTSSRRTAPARAGSWAPPTTSTPTASGPSTTTRRSWVWPPTAIWPRVVGDTTEGDMGDPAVRQPAGARPTPPSTPPSAGTTSTTSRAPWCSRTRPTGARNPEDANWAAPLLFGRWAWDGVTFRRDALGPGIDLIDATYAYGFSASGRASCLAGTVGGFPVAYYYSSAYNAGYGSWGLASQDYRDQGILGYQFMIDHTQSGPYSWWESASAPPEAASPWVGSHPGGGQGSAPHSLGHRQCQQGVARLCSPPSAPTAR